MHTSHIYLVEAVFVKDLTNQNGLSPDYLLEILSQTETAILGTWSKSLVHFVIATEKAGEVVYLDSTIWRFCCRYRVYARNT